LIQNKGHHDQEYNTRCECEECICDSYPYDKLCYFCSTGEHTGHECGNHLELRKDIVSCIICNKEWHPKTVEVDEN